MDKFKQLACRFRYTTAGKKPDLYKCLMQQDFDMALYIIQNHPDSITDKDYRLGSAHLLPATCYEDKHGFLQEGDYKKWRKASLKCLKALLETSEKNKIPTLMLESLIWRAASQRGGEMLETLFEFPAAVTISSHTLYDYTYYYFFPKDDPRRKDMQLDTRDSDLITEAGSPELIPIVEKFDKKRLEWQARRKLQPSVPPKRLQLK